MSEDRNDGRVAAEGRTPANPPLRPAFLADEAQPAAAINEHDALSEREDGTNRGESAPVGAPKQVPVETQTVPLAADEQQPASAVHEHNALSEREDGVNRG
jgi:hypothetical protein